MMWIIGLLALVAVSALFNSAIFGISTRWLLLIVLVLFVGYVAYYQLTHTELYEELIQSEQIIITKQGSGDDDFPLYGQNAAYYYIIYPAVNYRISRDTSCARLDPYDRDTWCGEERYFPRCNTPDEPNNCVAY